MPELPEVEVLRRSLEPLLLGERIGRVEVREPRLRERVRPRSLTRRLSGRTIESVRRRGKYLLIDVEGGSTLVVHLGMSGRLTLVASATPAEAHEHVVLHLASGLRLRLRDPRRFGLALALPTRALAADPHFAHLGTEPFAEEFDGALLARAARGRRGPVKPFLMDATVVVGVGNIYASEALHRAGIHPRRSVARIAGPRWERLAESIRGVLAQAIAEGGTTLNDFSDGAGRQGAFQVSLAVYDRTGEPCPRCGAAVRRITQTGRSTYYCPSCQR